MKEFIEKLIGRLEELNLDGIRMIEDGKYELIRKKEAISIVYELAEKYQLLENIEQLNNGWIPCSSGNFSTSEVLVCKEDGTIDFDVFDFMDEDWKFNSNHHKNKVLAWMPLPAPYKEGE